MPQDNYVKIKRFGVLSVARTFAIFGVAAGMVALLISVAVGASGLVPGFSVVAGVGIGLVVLVVSIVCTFIGGAVESFLYNMIVKAVGAVRIVLVKGAISKVDPLSYAKVSFVFGIIIYGLLALCVSSVLLATIGVNSSGVASTSLVASAFVFALILYGFVLPYIWALIYNWLAGNIGGIGVVIEKDVLQRVDVWSYVKVMVALSVIVFILERVIGTAVGIALRMPAPGQVLVAVAGFFAVIVVSLVANILLAWFYNVVAKRFGGIGVHIKK
jgi:hypothetical protein